MSAETAARPAALPTQRPAGTSAGYRRDIQGLRAVAVGLVVLYHAGLPWLPGGFVGVDIFFVISGFLITQGLVQELAVRGKISLAGFYARRARRILPAATVTLLGTVALAVAFLPSTRWLQLGEDVVSSSTYLMNWELAGRSIDYLARDQAASPLQHFWSLAVEEQFYVVWPVALLAAAAVATAFRRRRGRRVRSVGSQSYLLLALALVAVPSFAWSVHLTQSDPGPAYFVSTTRLWELGLGAGLAIVLADPRFRAGPRAARVVGGLGLAAIGVTALTFTAAVPFPGYAALLPTLGATAVLWAGASGHSSGSATLLGLRPMVWVGGLSYSLYLWHWPLIVVATAMTGTLRIRYGLAVALFSLVPAWLSLHLVEQPALRAPSLKSDNAKSLQLGAICTLLGVVAGLGLQVNVLGQTANEPTGTTGTTGAPGTATAPAPPSTTNPGAAVLATDATAGIPAEAFASIVPSALTASGDAPQIDGHGCTIDLASTAATPCSFGNLESAVTLALVGDSHADQLVPGIEQAALAHGWRLDVYTRGSCPFTDVMVDLDGRANEACDERNKNVTTALLADPPDLLLVATSRYQVFKQGGSPSLEASKTRMASGFQGAWEPFVAQGVPVVTFRDTPRPDVLVPDCVAQNEQTLTQCAMDRSAIVWDDAPEVTAAEGMPLVHVLDLTDWICPTDRCPVVIGGVLIYRDGNHLTATYSRSLGEPIGAQLAAALG
ncbi:acyltransferase family protein [Pengzhenrongella frigida]|uniref:Acyltransferase n=1 Tax=Pengzhenrongella frigida TaxID=1259133 RepID=A0A4V1ZHA5_9MICO|nr:acyltransferase family protein [Cellulomonas sp. HLT2-17]RYV51364.1 acyltransferase [Cellulomonas sp. HLT2-17]